MPDLTVKKVVSRTAAIIGALIVASIFFIVGTWATSMWPGKMSWIWRKIPILTFNMPSSEAELADYLSGSKLFCPAANCSATTANIDAALKSSTPVTSTAAAVVNSLGGTTATFVPSYRY